ncbi:hypothetical protein PHYSODRAFT_288938 [Phytophthora sojae]|uniref:RxLR effector protein n=2 Tax=Phytophthora sojae TaxID=67593 RepID=G5AAR3_PHYSP|nr:hypothetical protein PHYSODRAFT_288938 [Phytophthora sojae]AEK80591.1 Avh65 [Phytophthora sojae]AEK80592.1 Avh65 [Phytophthora sojae]AEK80593.1 Avh65 [Phytophthora sojae]EGZ07692.1 hypothetical protein PHYSODRAFT_288938 [Phytophthora sojae]|eukprot:XP_009537258.1 hypothetical protein PHYSODRAFT_288938 [Phytophthora sojae]
MRLGRGVLLVATISLLSSSNAVPATTGKSKGLKLQGDSSDKRYLRVHKAISTTRDEEERTFDLKKKTPNDFARKILNKMTQDDVYKLEMFAKWQQHGLSNGEVALKLNVPYGDKYLPLLLEYLNHIQPTVSGVAKKPRIRFGGVDVRYFHDDETLQWLRHFGR